MSAFDDWSAAWDQLAACFGLKRGRSKISDRALLIRASNIRDAARLVVELSRTTSITNLGQGLPEFPAPQILKDAAIRAVLENFNQYTNTWGDPRLREAIARKLARHNGITADPETEITVTCGVSEALNATLLATVNPGDEVIIIEPFYENYLPNAIIAGATPRYVRLRAPDFTFDEDELKRAFNNKTRAILINTPHNPSGRVFNRNELQLIADLCQKWDALAISDEIYEYMTYDGHKHLSIAALPGMKERAITLSGLSKTFSVTGWRLGYAVAPPEYSTALRKLHDYLTLAAPSPLQAAGIVAMDLPDAFYQEMNRKYLESRNRLMPLVEKAGFKFRPPEGTYYLFSDCSHLGFKNDRQAWEYMLRELGLATVAGYCFYRPKATTQNIRFCYAKQPTTIDAASLRLEELQRRVTSGNPLVITKP